LYNLKYSFELQVASYEFAERSRGVLPMKRSILL